MIFVKNLDLARLLPDRETEDEQRKLRHYRMTPAHPNLGICVSSNVKLQPEAGGLMLTESDPNGDQGGDVDVVGLFIAFPGGETSDGFDLYH